MYFFSKLAVEGVRIRQIKSSCCINGTWDPSPVIEFDPHGHMPSIEKHQSTWLKPRNWQQGGYDIVQINVCDKSLRCVQVTRSSSHSFKTEHVEALLNQIKYVLLLDIQHLEIRFLIPTSSLESFVVEKPSYPGLFEEYHVFAKKPASRGKRAPKWTISKSASLTDP